MWVMDGVWQPPAPITLPCFSQEAIQLILQGWGAKSSPNPGKHVSCVSTAASLLVKDVSHT